MKKYILICFGSLLLFNQMRAQNNNIKIHPLHLLSSKFEFERKINDAFTVGAIGTGYFMYSGFKIEPYGRYYLKHNEKNDPFIGAYVQAKAHYSRAVNKQTEVNELVSEYGFSAALGYQFRLSDKFTMDLFTGYRFSKLTFPSTSEFTTTYKTFYCSPFDLGISVGYRFGADQKKIGNK